MGRSFAPATCMFDGKRANNPADPVVLDKDHEMVDTGYRSIELSEKAPFYVYVLMLVYYNRTQNHQASFAMMLFGYVLTMYLRPSSSNKIPIPYAIGKNQYSAGMMAVCSTLWNFGT